MSYASELALLVDEARTSHDVDWLLSQGHDHWVRMAQHVCTRTGVDHDLFNDALQVILEHAWGAFDDPDVSVAKFGPYVVYRASLAFAKVLRSRTPMSGMSKIMERRSALERTRRALVAELGVPDIGDEQLVAEHNTRVLARNPRAGSQGGLARLSDLRAGTSSVVSVEAVADRHDMSASAVMDTLHSVTDEGPLVTDFADVLLRAIGKFDTDDASVLITHVGFSMENGHPMPMRDLARSTGRSVAECVALTDELRRVVMGSLT